MTVYYPGFGPLGTPERQTGAPASLSADRSAENALEIMGFSRGNIENPRISHRIRCRALRAFLGRFFPGNALFLCNITILHFPLFVNNSYNLYGVFIPFQHNCQQFVTFFVMHRPYLSPGGLIFPAPPGKNSLSGRILLTFPRRLGILKANIRGFSRPVRRNTDELL